MPTTREASTDTPFLRIDIQTENIHAFFGGIWTSHTLADIDKQKQELLEIVEAGSFHTFLLDGKELQDWDTSFLAFITHIAQIIYAQEKTLRIENIPQKAEELFQLALAVPKRQGSDRKKREESFLEAIGGAVLNVPKKSIEALAFFGETICAFGRLFTGKSRMYKQDLWLSIYDCSVNSLAIVSLTSLLLGLILAFVSAVQLKLFGAEVYVASFVGLSMVRIMGALLTGIILSGRMGASFAAIIGTMQVNEEVDALQTFGISPHDFLVLPRVIALTLMSPLLTLYANILGMFGGFLVGLMLGISPSVYLSNTLEYMKLSYLWIGLFHAFVFGIVISLSGCYQGIRCGRSAEAVGIATTSAVVISIVGIIVATSIITLFTTILGI